MQIDKLSDPHTALSLTEQLYTARGSQGFGTQKTMTQPSSFNVDVTDYRDTVLM